MLTGTLVFIIRDGMVLLGLKKRGHGEGKWHGFGGKILDGESAITAAIRETKEEVLVTPQNMASLGLLEFYVPSEANGGWNVHVFRTGSFFGEPRETEEMRPQWFSVKTIPLSAMWPSDSRWMPYVLAGQKFHAQYWFDKNDRLIKENVKLL